MQAADSSPSAPRHEPAVVGGTARRPAWLEEREQRAEKGEVWSESSRDLAAYSLGSPAGDVWSISEVHADQ